MSYLLESIETAPKDEEVLIVYKRYGKIMMQSATLTDEVHGKGIWSWCVNDYKHGPFPLRGYSSSGLIGWISIKNILEEITDDQKNLQNQRL